MLGPFVRRGQSLCVLPQWPQSFYLPAGKPGKIESLEAETILQMSHIQENRKILIIGSVSLMPLRSAHRVIFVQSARWSRSALSDVLASGRLTARQDVLPSPATATTDFIVGDTLDSCGRAVPAQIAPSEGPCRPIAGVAIPRRSRQRSSRGSARRFCLEFEA